MKHGIGKDIFSDAENLWNTVLQGIKKKVTPRTFNTWFKSTKAVRVSENRLLVAVPNEFYREWLGIHFSGLIDDILDEMQLPYRVEYIVNGHLNRSSATRVLTLHPQSRIQKRYSFDNFIVGNSNQLAYSAALAVAREPFSNLYNPLVLYGGPGLGKSHLLHAVGNFIHSNFPHHKVYYVHAESLMNELISALKNDQMSSFRQKFRTLDVLLIDDIHFLKNKSLLQEELTYTINYLQSMNKRIVLTSNRHPKEIPALSKSLISRLQGGLVVEIGAPDLESRVKILASKARAVGLKISRKSILYIAEHVRDSIRELEGCINRLKAAQTLLRKDLTFETVQEILREFVRESPTPTPEQVLRMTARVFRVKARHLTGKRRYAEIVRARHAAAYVLHILMGFTLDETGQILGKRDHTTILNSVRKAQALKESNPVFRENLEKLKDLLGL